MVGSQGGQWPSAQRLFASGLLRFVIVVAALSIAVVVALGIGTVADVDCGTGIVDVELAATPDRAADALAGCGDDEVRTALFWDFALIVWYVGVLAAAALFVAGKIPRLGHGGYRVRSWRAKGSAVAAIAVVAGLLDVVENVLLLIGLEEPADVLSVSAWAAAGAASAGWAKFVLLVIVGLYVLAGAAGWIAMLSHTLASPMPLVVEDAREPQVGISLSGGGVRAGTYGLGVLQRLDRAGLYDRARWVSAVSGGSYMAGAWAIARSSANAPEDPALADAEPRPWADPRLSEASGSSPEVDHLRRNLGYLVTREGGLAGAIAVLVVGFVVNLAVLVCVLWLMTRALGWVIGSWVMTDAAADGELSFEFDRHYWLPVVVWAVAFGAVAVLWVTLRRLGALRRRTGKPFVPRWTQRSIWQIASGAGAVTVALAVLLLAAPALVAAIPDLLGDRDALAGVLNTVVSGGFVATLIALVLKPLSPVLPRLGGLLAVALAILIGSYVARGAAERGAADDWVLWTVVFGVFALVYYLVDPDVWSMQPYYRGRLREAYATRRTPPDPDDGDGGGEIRVVALDPSEEPDLAALRDERPRLMVCTAMNVSGSEPRRVGVPAYSFTFSPEHVRVHAPGTRDGSCLDVSVDTERYAKVFRRWDTPRLTPMTAVGLSGAAVSSAMGRHNKGSTNALLTLANVRLGLWVPNPRVVDDGRPLPARGAPGYPRRRIGYLLKEMFGVYDPDDLYVYVTDGGHWDNLGLVELIRRRCDEVFCVDASGSQAHGFGAVAASITLAAQECGATVELPLEPLRAAVGARFAPRDWALGVIEYSDGSMGLLWYMKSSLTDDVPSRLFAYDEQNEIFPHDPTTNQFFDTEKFECYRLLGQHTAGHMLAARASLAARVPITEAVDENEPFAPEAELLRRLVPPDAQRQLLSTPASMS